MATFHRNFIAALIAVGAICGVLGGSSGAHALEPLRQSPPPGATQVLGVISFEKLLVDGGGLHLDNPTPTPAPGVTVEIVDAATQTAMARTTAGEDGSYQATVPGGSVYYVRANADSVKDHAIVVDLTTLAEYSASSPTFLATAGANVTVNLLATDARRIAGVFNILLQIHQARLFLQAAGNVVIPNVTVRWDTKYADGAYASTGVEYSEITLSGNRVANSDEFDDAVILHEYGHCIQALNWGIYGPGGTHSLGDQLDPRTAWNEGLPTFLSAAIRNNPIYIDTGAGGTVGVKIDLTKPFLPSEDPGYWSEQCVCSGLWATLSPQTPGVSFSQMWPIISSFGGWTYLVSFFDLMVKAQPSLEGSIATILANRGIAGYHYREAGNPRRPSIANPFLPLLHAGPALSDAVTSAVPTVSDPGRANGFTSSRFYTVSVPTFDATVVLKLKNQGDGSGYPHFVQLFLWDQYGAYLKDSGAPTDSGGTATITYSADISAYPRPYYVLEVRSFQDIPTAGQGVLTYFNSTAYQLSRDPDYAWAVKIGVGDPEEPNFVPVLGTAGINNASPAQVTGYWGSLEAGNEGSGFIWAYKDRNTPPSFRDLGQIPSVGGQTAGINNAGIVVANGSQPVVWNGNFATLPGSTSYPNGPFNQVFAINNSGQIVGNVEQPSGQGHLARAAMWSYPALGTPTDLGSLATPDPTKGTSYATAINDNGDVVGVSSTNDSSEHAFLYTGGRMTDLGTLTGNPKDDSHAYGINAGKVVVGDGNVSSNEFHACVWNNGSPTDLHDPRWADALSLALAVNKKGIIVGTVEFANRTAAAVWRTKSSGGYEGVLLQDLLAGDESVGLIYPATAINDLGQVTMGPSLVNLPQSFLNGDPLPPVLFRGRSPRRAAIERDTQLRTVPRRRAKSPSGPFAASGPSSDILRLLDPTEPVRVNFPGTLPAGWLHSVPELARVATARRAECGSAAERRAASVAPRTVARAPAPPAARRVRMAAR